MNSDQHESDAEKDQAIDPKLDTGLIERSRALFDESVASLDAATRSRLTQARHAALAAVSTAQRSPLHGWVPVGSAAAVALATVVGVHFWRASHTPAAVNAPVVAATQVDDLELLTADADLDMLKDMDFYAWLDSQDLNAIEPDSEAG